MKQRVTPYRPTPLVVLAVLVVCCAATACGPSNDQVRPAGGTSASPPAPDLTRCDRVVPPRGGFVDGDFSVDPDAASLGLDFSDRRKGRYRNVAYTIAYLDDPTCRSAPEVRRLLDRVEPPGWAASR